MRKKPASRPIPKEIHSRLLARRTGQFRLLSSLLSHRSFTLLHLSLSLFLQPISASDFPSDRIKRAFQNYSEVRIGLFRIIIRNVINSASASVDNSLQDNIERMKQHNIQKRASNEIGCYLNWERNKTDGCQDCGAKFHMNPESRNISEIKPGCLSDRKKYNQRCETGLGFDPYDETYSVFNCYCSDERCNTKEFAENLKEKVKLMYQQEFTTTAAPTTTTEETTSTPTTTTSTVAEIPASNEERLGVFAYICLIVCGVLIVIMVVIYIRRKWKKHEEQRIRVQREDELYEQQMARLRRSYKEPAPKKEPVNATKSDTKEEKAPVNETPEKKAPVKETPEKKAPEKETYKEKIIDEKKEGKGAVSQNDVKK